ncbi:MAG: hypothetical protein M3454_01425 [Actinomycetota bacterium]|nr:hypothetical protein [Actinomycetota bacterium]
MKLLQRQSWSVFQRKAQCLLLLIRGANQLSGAVVQLDPNAVALAQAGDIGPARKEALQRQSQDRAAERSPAADLCTESQPEVIANRPIPG